MISDETVFFVASKNPIARVMRANRLHFLFAFTCIAFSGCNPNKEPIPKIARSLENIETPYVDSRPVSTYSLRDVQHLIDSLVSPNSPPGPGRNQFLEYPDDFDFQAQQEIWNAYQKLTLVEKKFIPVLLDNLDDDRISMVWSSSIEYKVTVGSVCADAIRSNVQIVGVTYKVRCGGHGEYHGCPDYFDACYQGDLQKWWMENQHKTLKEMRKEILTWRIKQEKQIGFPNSESRKIHLEPLVETLRGLN